MLEFTPPPPYTVPVAQTTQAVGTKLTEHTLNYEICLFVQKTNTVRGISTFDVHQPTRPF